MLNNSIGMNDFNLLTFIINFPAAFTANTNNYHKNNAGKNSSNSGSYNNSHINACIISIVDPDVNFFV